MSADSFKARTLALPAYRTFVGGIAVVAREQAAAIAAEADTLREAAEGLRVALVELLACETESAGWTVSMFSDRTAFDAMMQRNLTRIEAAKAAAHNALATFTQATGART